MLATLDFSVIPALQQKLATPTMHLHLPVQMQMHTFYAQKVKL